MKFYIFEDVSGESDEIKETIVKQGHEIVCRKQAEEDGVKIAENLLISYTLFCRFCHGEKSIKELLDQMEKWEKEGHKVYLLYFSNPCNIEHEKLRLDKFKFFKI